MATEDRTERALGALFAAGREGPEVSDALIARMLAGAEASLPAASGPVLPPPRRAGLGGLLRSLVGSWPAMAGMATAALAGVWIGFTTPTLVEGYLGVSTASAAEGYAMTDFMPDMLQLASGE